MANPFFNSVPTQFHGIDMGRVKQIYNMLCGSSNPNQLLDQMTAQNPQLAQTVNLIRANGNYEQVFRGICKERGINPDEFIRVITQS